jgi:hypothetical protein
MQEMLIYFHTKSEREFWVRAVTPSAVQVPTPVTLPAAQVAEVNIPSAAQVLTAVTLSAAQVPTAVTPQLCRYQ